MRQTKCQQILHLEQIQHKLNTKTPSEMHVAPRIVVHCSPLISIVVHCCPMLSIAVHCCLLLSIIAHCCPLLPIVIHCCPLLSIVVHCCYPLRISNTASRWRCHWNFLNTDPYILIESQLCSEAILW